MYLCHVIGDISNFDQVVSVVAHVSSKDTLTEHHATHVSSGISSGV